MAGGSFGGGTGMVGDPFLVEDAADLAAVSSLYNSHFLQVNDISLDGEAVAPICDAESDPFTGVYDGDGYVIEDMTIDDPGEDYLGLFGMVGDCTIKNVKLINATVVGTSDLGLLVGHAYGMNSEIKSCFVQGSVTGSGNNVGGLSGCGASFEDCGGIVDVVGASVVGGLGGDIGNGQIRKRCYAVGSVEGTGTTGGLFGNQGWEQEIDECYSACVVTGTGDVGSLVGHVSSPEVITNCYYDAEKTGFVDDQGTSRTTQEMKYFDTNSVFEGWDFDTEWERYFFESEGYPFLQSIGPLNNVIELSTPQDLDDIRNDLTAAYVQLNDIDMSTFGEWSSIGAFGNPFRGYYEGNGHKITGLEGTDSTGFFGFIAEAEIQRLGVEGTFATSYPAGGFAADVNYGSRIYSCYFKGEITSSTPGALFVGYVGQMGSSDSVIEDCYAEGVLARTDEYSELGGFVYSVSSNAQVRRCIANVDFDGPDTGEEGTWGYTAGFVYTLTPGGTIELSYYNVTKALSLSEGDPEGVTPITDEDLKNGLVDETFSQVTSGTIIHEMGDSQESITWPGEIVWIEGHAPVLLEANAKAMVELTALAFSDGSEEWFGKLALTESGSE